MVDHEAPLSVRRQCLGFSKPPPESAQVAGLGWYRRLALSAAPASRPLHLADLECHHLRPHARTMGLADGRHRLAEAVGNLAVTLASLGVLNFF